MRSFLLFVLSLFFLTGCPSFVSNLDGEGNYPLMVFVNETDQEVTFTVSGQEYKVEPKGCGVTNDIAPEGEGDTAYNKYTKKANGEIVPEKLDEPLCY